jgi:hypothetical protein
MSPVPSVIGAHILCHVSRGSSPTRGRLRVTVAGVLTKQPINARPFSTLPGMSALITESPGDDVVPDISSEPPRRSLDSANSATANGVSLFPAEERDRCG